MKNDNPSEQFTFWKRPSGENGLFCWQQQYILYVFTKTFQITKKFPA